MVGVAVRGSLMMTSRLRVGSTVVTPAVSGEAPVLEGEDGGEGFDGAGGSDGVAVEGSWWS